MPNIKSCKAIYEPAVDALNDAIIAAKNTATDRYNRLLGEKAFVDVRLAAFDRVEDFYREAALIRNAINEALAVAD